MQLVWLVTVDVPSGAGKREGEAFFNLEVPCLMRLATTSIILGGEFNCILENTDITWYCTYSRTLTELGRRFYLVDVWAQAEGRRIFTHYTPNGTTRLARIYVIGELLGGKRGMEKIVTALSDHRTVLLFMALHVKNRPIWHRALENERGLTKLDVIS
jgi:hypothetical protein